MLKLLKKETHTPQTERIYKVPLCIQDTIPIYRIAENGIFELEKPTSGSKKGIHQFDRMYLFEDINFSTQDEEEKEDTCSKFETLLRSMNVSYKIIVSNHYADNNKLREEILQKAVSKEMEPLAKEYHKMIGERLEEGRGGLLQSKYFVVSCRKPDYESAKTYFNTIEFSIQQLFHRLGSCLIPLDATERLRALHSYYRMGEEASFSFDWNEYLHLKRDWRNDIINTSLREKPEHLEMEGGTCACVMFVRKYPNGLTDQFLNELTNMNFPIIYTMDVEPLDNNVAYQMIMKKYMAITAKIKYNQSDGVATWVYVDEMHELWGEEYSLHALEKMWREVRKRGGICTGMSQNLIDAQRNRSTKTMVSNSEFMLLLDQGTMDKEAVEDLFDISAEQLACVNGADPGMGLIRFGDKIVPFDNTMKKDSELYQLFNTNFHEIAGTTR